MSTDLNGVLAAIGHHVRHHREKNGLTQARLAELAEVQPGHIQKIEYGTARPSLALLARLADALNVPFWALCKPTRAKNPKKRARGRPRARKKR